MNIAESGANELIITGNIKSIEDSKQIQSAVELLLKTGVKNITLKINDSFSMTSTVIGYLMKVINVDKIQLSLVVGDRRLYKLLEDLSLSAPFRVRQAGEPATVAAN